MDKTTKTLIIVMFISLIILGALASRLPDDKKKPDETPVATAAPTMAPVSNKPSAEPYVIYVTPTPVSGSTEPVYVAEYATPTDIPAYQPIETVPTFYVPPTATPLPTPTAIPTPTAVPTPTIAGSMGTPTAAPSNSSIKVTFINVGQGDSTLIMDNGSAMMIDTGPKEAVGTIEAILNENGVSRIDTMVLTHPDADHIQGAITLLDDYTVGNIYMPDYTKDNGTNRRLLGKIDQYQIPVHRPEVGAYIPFGAASYQMLGPFLNEIPYYEEERDLANYYSIVIKLTNGADTFLFMGDAPGAETDAILNAGFDVSAKVFKAAHHGSANEGCNNNALWKAVNPESVVISCGLYNDHGHPHEEVMNEAKKRGCKLFRTDLQGTISCTSTGNGIIWDIEPTNDYRNGRAIY